jgi:hypothetical protein
MIIKQSTNTNISSEMELGSEDSDEGSQSEHGNEESVTNKGLASENDIVLEGPDNRECGELEQVKGEQATSEPELSSHSHLLIECVMEGLEMDSFSFGVPTCAIEGLGTGPEVSTQDIEAIMDGSLTGPIFLNSELEPTRMGSSTDPIFLDSEPTRVGRKWKAKDMSGLSICLCGEHAKPDDVGSIRCRKAGCATVWVCCSTTFSKFVANTTYSTIFNVLGMRMRDQGAGYVSHACASQAQARRLGIASMPVPAVPVLVLVPLLSTP